MNSRSTQEILSWYGSDNPGTLTNLARLLKHGKLAGTGKMVILPVDQGFEHGPARSFAANPPAYDPRYHFELAVEAGCNAYAAPLGFLEAGAREFAGQIPLILKVNDHDVLVDEADPHQALTGSVDDALRLGCVISPGVRIGRDCQLEECVVLSGAEIGNGAKLRRVFVEEGARVPPGTRVRVEGHSEHRGRSEPGVVVLQDQETEADLSLASRQSKSKALYGCGG